MKYPNFRKMLALALFACFMLTVSCGKGSNEQGTDAASEANGDIYGSDTPAEDAGSGETPQEMGPAVPADTTTTTNNGNSTAKGSGTN